jgi:exodeoxyribonuclease VII large subunit
VRGRVIQARRAEEQAAARLVPILPARIARDAARVEAASAALAVLGPQATLDRGYAIVRRSRDDGIVRDPADAPPGTPLHLRVARGELPATAGEQTAPSRGAKRRG